MLCSYDENQLCSVIATCTCSCRDMDKLTFDQIPIKPLAAGSEQSQAPLALVTCPMLAKIIMATDADSKLLPIPYLGTRDY